MRNRDDIHKMSMKIVRFLRPSTPLSIYVQKSSTPLILDVQFRTNTPYTHTPPTPPPSPSPPPPHHRPPLQIITSQLKENMIHGWFQFGFHFQYQLINLAWFSFDFFQFSWSLTICFFLALYSCACSCPKISRNVFYL